MKTLLVTLFFLATSLMSFGGDQLSAFTNSLDAYLKKYIFNGSVAYGKIK